MGNGNMWHNQRYKFLQKTRKNDTRFINVIRVGGQGRGIRGATQKFPKFECRAKTACSTVVGL
jgi:hypothetical protein